MADFCEKCGRNIALVGRMHYCRPMTACSDTNAYYPREPVTLPVTLEPPVTLVTPVVTLDVANESPADRVKRLARERQQRKRAKA